MAKRYTLYLDESETHKHDRIKQKDSDYHFCMAGVVVAEVDYALLQNSVKQLKRNEWPELPNPNIFGVLRYNLYDGYMTSRERFRIKYMP